MPKINNFRLFVFLLWALAALCGISSVFMLSRYPVAWRKSRASVANVTAINTFSRNMSNVTFEFVAGGRRVNVEEVVPNSRAMDLRVGKALSVSICLLMRDRLLFNCLR
ncbi:hypothetical protein BH11ARM1_BH11ARM1_03530 [soil metagenome]